MDGAAGGRDLVGGGFFCIVPGRVVMNEFGVFPISDDLYFELAASYQMAYGTSYHALVQRGELKKDDEEIKKIELPNGLRLLLREDSSLPFTHFRYGSRSGVLSENLK